MSVVRSVMYFVEQPAVAAAWWAEFLGVPADHLLRDDSFFYFDVEGVEFGFHLADPELNPQGASSVVYLRVGDHAAAVARSTSHGARLHRGPLDVDEGRVIAQFLDPFGNVFGLDGSRGDEPPATLDGDVVLGVVELHELLESLDPVLLDGEFVFVSTPPSEFVEGAVAMVKEVEGLTFVLRREDADRQSFEYEFVAAWITLRVTSALDGVGLTAAVSTALARAGISCNVLAGFHHDHLLVPFTRRDEALLVVRELTRASLYTQ